MRAQAGKAPVEIGDGFGIDATATVGTGGGRWRSVPMLAPFQVNHRGRQYLGAIGQSGIVGDSLLWRFAQ